MSITVKKTILKKYCKLKLSICCYCNYYTLLRNYDYYLY